ncbi:fasciclin-like arabinogalactan protein 21 [Punica granatum]|uniref:FAS1 domain-containing protein n=2 Tax=Punica granatum TaxID=22663 RepID=A0A218VQ74_PUNGR|nr:fasciclin-like arabinogalactan protein 21 [Punica granatum]OWM62677.1 hypothetical protein CDL15_Pgr019971 [Punica granatum]PKI53454.1 hypothetical protein CRG98_026144 [Punica granatum]
MASRALQFTAAFIFYASIVFPTTAATWSTSFEDSFTSSPLHSQQQQLHDSLSPTALFEPILSHLGFHELAMAVPSLADSPSFTTWNGPSTVFAPSDTSIRSCNSCSAARLLSEHVVPGLFAFNYLQTLAFGTKVETMSSGHCLTVTSGTNGATNSTKIFINGVEITKPDMFNNGLVVVHGLHGFVSALSPFSCSVEKMTPLVFPAQHTAAAPPSPVMRLMLRDAMLRLRTSGFGILALGLKIKFPDLVGLHNATIFAIDDASIFGGSHSYVSNMRFHIVPNRYLAITDLEKLTVGTVLPTLDRGQYLVVTSSGGLPTLRINYVRVKFPEVMKNPKVVVHALFLPFPHLHPASVSSLVNGQVEVDHAAAVNQTANPSCAAPDEHGGCGVIPPPEYREGL